jgi:hypothetical protein
MPSGNNFEHALYSRADPAARVLYRERAPDAPPDSPAWHDAMSAHGRALSSAGVRVIAFVQGCTAGTDVFGVSRLDEAGGLKRGYSRGIPGVDGLLALMRDDTNGLPAIPGVRPPLADEEHSRRLLDQHVGDAANVPATMIESCHRALNAGTPHALRCERVLWSAAHHHLGRARAAADLIRRLRALRDEMTLVSGDRMLVIAHGQAGLLLALVSNFLAPGHSAQRERVIDILKASGSSDVVLDLLRGAGSESPLGGSALDVVTLGTPVRYGWDPSGLGHLLHIVNHRPMRLDGKRWLAKMELPQITMEMPIAWGGDYVQQLAVAGTDAVPATAEEKAFNKALWEVLEPYDGFERWLECARKCVRCQPDGEVLLVDYKDGGSTVAKDHCYGHAAYTRSNHLLFLFTEIVSRFYSSA